MFSYLTSKRSTLKSLVKGIDFEITFKIWKTIFGLKYIGVQVSKGNIVATEISTRFNILGAT